jgi:lysophospholipase L1-like esterase
MERKPPGFPGLTEAVWGADPAAWPARTRWEQQSELLRIVTSAWIAPGNYEADFAARFAPNLQLFEAIYDRIAARCAQSNIELKVALLGGRSLVAAPGSTSAQYQKVLGEGITAMLRRKQREPINVPARMAASGGSPAAALFFPNDGHLTAEGHKVVAEILREALGAPR